MARPRGKKLFILLLQKTHKAARLLTVLQTKRTGAAAAMALASATFFSASIKAALVTTLAASVAEMPSALGSSMIASRCSSFSIEFRVGVNSLGRFFSLLFCSIRLL